MYSTECLTGIDRRDTRVSRRHLGVSFHMCSDPWQTTKKADLEAQFSPGQNRVSNGHFCQFRNKESSSYLFLIVCANYHCFFFCQKSPFFRFCTPAKIQKSEPGECFCVKHVFLWRQNCFIRQVMEVPG